MHGSGRAARTAGAFQPPVQPRQRFHEILRRVRLLPLQLPHRPPHAHAADPQVGFKDTPPGDELVRTSIVSAVTMSGLAGKYSAVM